MHTPEFSDFNDALSYTNNVVAFTHQHHIIIDVHGVSKPYKVYTSDFVLDRLYYHGEYGKKMFFTHIATIGIHHIVHTRKSPLYELYLQKFRKQFNDVVKMTEIYLNDEYEVYAGEWIDSMNVPNFNSGFLPDLFQTIKFID